VIVANPLHASFTGQMASTLSVNLSGIDLNLLVSLEALLEHCNVTRAADRVGLSQPAMSRALSRLRGMFSDDLLVRTSAGYVRTIRGEQLHERLPVTLDSVRELVSSRSAIADQALSAIRLAIPDHQALVVLPHLLDRMRKGPVNAEIVTEPLTSHVLRRLESGELDMAVGQVGGSATGFFQRSLYVDTYACLLRQDHPAVRDGWSAERFYELQHAIIAPGHDAETNQVADALSGLSPSHRCIVSFDTMGIAMTVVDSDLVLTVPRRTAAKIAAILPLRMIEVPVEIAPYQVALLWHERSHRNTEHGWIRSQIAAAAQCSAPEQDVEQVKCVAN